MYCICKPVLNLTYLSKLKTFWKSIERLYIYIKYTIEIGFYLFAILYAKYITDAVSGCKATARLKWAVDALSLSSLELCAEPSPLFLVKNIFIYLLNFKNKVESCYYFSWSFSVKW